MITNKLNLPESFVNYANRDDHEVVENRYSVTELLKSTREILLYRKYAGKINKDVSDLIPALFGTAVHNILEQSTPLYCDMFTEEPVECEIDGTTISGRIDLLNLRDFLIEDYKTCSVSKIMKQDFDDWKMQGIMYAYLLFKQRGIILKGLRFYALMKDWSKIKCATSANYPSSAVYVWKYDINDSDYDYIEQWFRSRIQEINNHLINNTLPECTSEERWNTGDKYAVYKKAGDKRAYKIVNSEEEAHQLITDELGGAGEIEIRKGEDLKCNYYCDVCQFCKEADI